ncbi:MAG: glycerophosphodiester phosphodiesterase family protein [Sedimenticola sp.]|nr:glycerophosphodiester phosphodiesterase family protein [Sedimenticola sp.]
MPITPKQLIAHRGYMALYPENTWRGLKAALDLGARWVEFDIQMANEGDFILLHDDNFQRTAGNPCSAFNLDQATRATLSVHEPDRLGAQFYPESVIGLGEMLKNLKQYPNARAMVEIKEESLTRWGLEAVMDPLLKQLENHIAQCVLISFSLPALSYAKERSPIELGWVLRSYDEPSIEQARALSPRFLICNHTKLPANGSPADGPWAWMLYDLTDPIVINKWGERGIDLIETEDIGQLLESLDNHHG